MLTVEIAVIGREDHDRVVELPHLAERSHDARETLIDAEQHLEAVANVGIGRAGPRAERGQTGDRALKRRFPDERRGRVRPARYRGGLIAAAMALGRDEPRTLPRERRDRSVVALCHVRMERLVRDECQERRAGIAAEEIQDVSVSTSVT